MQAEREAPGFWRQIDGGTRAVPGNILAPKSAAAQRGMRLPEGNHLLEETEDVLIRPEVIPVQPADFIVLVVWIVVTELRVQELIAGPEHRDAVREQEQAAEVLDLVPAKRQNLSRRALVSFVAAVPTEILIHAILIVVSVLEVVL